MPATWTCEKCGFSDALRSLRETPVKTVPLRNGNECHVFAIESETVKRPSDACALEVLLFRCPKCGNEESG